MQCNLQQLKGTPTHMNPMDGARMRAFVTAGLSAAQFIFPSPAVPLGTYKRSLNLRINSSLSKDDVSSFNWCTRSEARRVVWRRSRASRAASLVLLTVFIFALSVGHIFSDRSRLKQRNAPWEKSSFAACTVSNNCSDSCSKKT